MKLQYYEHALVDCPGDWMVLLLSEDADLSSFSELDSALDGKLNRMRQQNDLETDLGSLTILTDLGQLSADRLLIVGLGSLTDLTRSRFARAVRTAGRRICTREAQKVAVTGIHDLSNESSLPFGQLVQTIATAMQVAGQSPVLYREKPDRFPLASLALCIPASARSVSVETGNQGTILGESINLCRELVNRAPNDIYPETFAARARDVASSTGLGIEILEDPQLEAERMQSLLAVARGSRQRPRLVVLRHEGGRPGSPLLALCGKGVTFDSGGLSLKTNDGMKTMKCDMAGAATVLAAMSAIARLNVPVNVIGLMGLVENMPDGAAFKLGDVLTARNGTTIEVHNTDAEGRLVLADVLAYAVDLGAERIVDLATLTGACVVALGMDFAGVFSNNPAMAQQILDAAENCGEDAWALPTADSFNEQLKSTVADVKNVGTRWGGAITAAKFLERFVGATDWVHLDIAGPAFADSSTADRDSGGTGCMVQTLVDWAYRQADSG